MHVLHVTEASGSGTLQVVLTLAHALADDGHHVDVAYGRRPETPPDLADAPPAGVTLHPIGWEARTVLAQARAGRALRRLVRRLSPDLVHLHSAFAGLVGALVMPRDVAMVYTPHASPLSRVGGSRASRAGAVAAERLIVHRCDLVGAVSEDEAALMRREAGALNVAVVPNGIPELDPGVAPGRTVRDGRPLAVAFGRVGAQRRPQEVAAILTGLRDLADVAWIGGAPANEDRPLREAGIHVTGWLTRTEALEHLGRATAYLHWSAWDGQSLALLEALARDVVVVASDIPANREVIGSRQLCRTAGEAQALLRRTLTEPELRGELLRDQRARRERWGAGRMAADWKRVYASLLGIPDRVEMPEPVHHGAGSRPKIGMPWS